MTVQWRHRPSSYGCQFEYDNPTPEPECECDLDEEYDGCPCCAPECECAARDWTPVIACKGGQKVRVQLGSGAYVECCSPEAHGFPVSWWGPIYGCALPPGGTSTLGRLMARMYPADRIQEMVDRTSALAFWFPTITP